MFSNRTRILGLILLLAHYTHTFVLLTASIDDVRKIARKFVSEPMAQQIADYIAKATGHQPAQQRPISAENEQNAAAESVNEYTDDNEINSQPTKRPIMKNDLRLSEQPAKKVLTSAFSDQPEYQPQETQPQDNQPQNYQLQKSPLRNNQLQNSPIRNNQLQDNQDNQAQNDQAQDNQAQNYQAQNNQAQNNQPQNNQPQNNQPQNSQPSENNFKPKQDDRGGRLIARQRPNRPPPKQWEDQQAQEHQKIQKHISQTAENVQPSEAPGLEIPDGKKIPTNKVRQKSRLSNVERMKRKQQQLRFKQQQNALQQQNYQETMKPQEPQKFDANENQNQNQNEEPNEPVPFEKRGYDDNEHSQQAPYEHKPEDATGDPVDLINDKEEEEVKPFKIQENFQNQYKSDETTRNMPPIMEADSQVAQNPPRNENIYQAATEDYEPENAVPVKRHRPRARHHERFALLNYANATTNPTMIIEFTSKISGFNIVPKKLTTEKQKNEFDQYDILKFNPPPASTPGSPLLATSGQVALTNRPNLRDQKWWETHVLRANDFLNATKEVLPPASVLGNVNPVRY